MLAGKKSISALEEAMVNNRQIVLAAQHQAKTNERSPRIFTGWGPWRK